MNFPIDAYFIYLIPWQIRCYLHTLKFLCQNHSSDNWKQILPLKQYFTLAKDMERPLLIELQIQLPIKSICYLELDYETAFLR